MDKEQRRKISLMFPELSSQLAGEETSENSSMMARMLQALTMIKGDKGDSRTEEEMIALIKPLIPEVKDGHTPTNEEILDLIRPLIPEVKDGHTPTKEELMALIFPLIPEPIPGTPGKNGDKIEPKEIASKLNTLKEVVDVSVIKGALKKEDLKAYDLKLNDGMKSIDGRIKLIDQRWHGGGLSRVSHDSTLSGSGTPADPLVVIGGGSSPLTTKGDIFGYSTLNARVPVGSNGQVLTADSTTALGVKWAAAAGVITSSDSSLTVASSDVIINTSHINLWKAEQSFLNSAGTQGTIISNGTSITNVFGLIMSGSLAKIATINAGTSLYEYANGQITYNNGLTYMGVNGGVSIGGSYFTTTPPTNGMIVQGNVGIGTASPSTLLQLSKSSSGAMGSVLTLQNTAVSALNGGNQIGFLNESGATSATFEASIKSFITNAANGASAITFETWNGTASGERLRIAADGNVGIGTANPTSKLHVIGLAYMSGSAGGFSIGSRDLSGDDFQFYNPTGDGFRIYGNTNGDIVGFDLTGKIDIYKGVATNGLGVPAIYKVGRSTAQTAAVASVAAYTNGAADGSFEVSANVLVTTATLHNFTVTCAYTDEGNTARTLTLTFSSLGGTLMTSIANATGAVPYEGVPLHIRCKASTSITIATVGTFTTCVYNVEGIIRQLS